MFVVTTRLEETLNYFIYDKSHPMGDNVRKAYGRSLNVLSALQDAAHTNFFAMTTKKVTKKALKAQLKHTDLVLKGMMEKQGYQLFFFEMSIHFVKDRKSGVGEEDIATMIEIMDRI